MITTSTLNPPSAVEPVFGVRRIAAAVLLVIALLAAAFLVGRVTASTHAATPTSATHSVSSTTDGCRPHVPC